MEDPMKRSRVAKAALAAALSLSIILPVGAQAAPYRRRLAFDHLESPAQLLTIRADGTGLVELDRGLQPRISSGGNPGYQPDWAPDGRHIVFSAVPGDENTGPANLYVVSADGSRLRRVTSPSAYRGDSYAIWSPNGRKLAFERVTLERGNAYVIGARGRNLQRVTHRSGFEPKWFPGGKKLYFYGNDSHYRRQVFTRTLPPRASDPTFQVTTSPDSPKNTTNEVPELSPDGEHFVYVRIDRRYRSGEHWELHIIDIRGHHDRMIWRGPGHDPEPEWAPGGKKIVFVSNKSPAGQVGDRDIYTIRADGTHVHRLTDAPLADSSPTWSPDGRRIAFETMRHGNKEIYVMHVDGFHENRVTFSDGDDEEPVWRP
jgi:Tol biopolymer transport system component